MALNSGSRAEIEHQVTEQDTAVALGSGTVAVLATPRVLAWLEEATVRAIAEELEPGTTTVGIRIELEHLAATPVGGTVRAVAELHEVDGRTLRFEVSLRDGDTLAARGRVERAVVHAERFLAKAQRD
ncbi:thioesterase family protein [Sciscionella marina]|uniref:thioesterase family protein n=1 Tax=Sciscionella marina TaxID=508770 RepID=UPI0003673446|nr:hotdog domain-containing protein [Sciscionella marina]